MFNQKIKDNVLNKLVIDGVGGLHITVENLLKLDGVQEQINMAEKLAPHKPKQSKKEKCKN